MSETSQSPPDYSFNPQSGQAKNQPQHSLLSRVAAGAVAGATVLTFSAAAVERLNSDNPNAVVSFVATPAREAIQHTVDLAGKAIFGDIEFGRIDPLDLMNETESDRTNRLLKSFGPASLPELYEVPTESQVPFVCADGQVTTGMLCPDN